MGSVFHSQLYSICETAVTQEALGTDMGLSLDFTGII